MQEHSIFGLLRSFSKDELIKFQSFLTSPYHNRSKRIIGVFKEIKKNHPDFPASKVRKDLISKKIFPNVKFNDSTIRNLYADLQNLLERFIIFEELKRNEFEKRNLLLKSFSEKYHIYFLNNHLKKCFSETESLGKDSSYYYFKSNLQMYRLNSNVKHLPQKEPKVIADNYKTTILYVICLVYFFITEMINAYCRVRIEKNKFSFDKKIDFLTNLINCLDLFNILKLVKRIDKDSFFLETYLNLFLAFQNFDSKIYFTKYRSLVFKNFNRFSSDEKSYHVSILISYCFMKNSSIENTANYDNELFTIYKFFLREKLFIDNKTKYIDEELFNSILTLSLRLKEFDWTHEFIKNFSIHLHPNKRNNLLTHAYAQYYYCLGISIKSHRNLVKSFDYLSNLHEESFIIKYNIRGLSIKLHYDLDYNDPLLQLIDNYRKFLLRNTLVTQERKQKMNKFLNLVERLVYLKEGDPKIDPSTLYFDILNSKNIYFKEWLLEKMKEFKIHRNVKLKTG